MIKVKITGKAGGALEQELPTDIHQLYYDMREVGISKPPKNILLHDDKDVDVKLSSDSEIGNRLLRVFGRNDTLADANTVAFAASTAREEILTDLEQNILHDQYSTKEMLFDDIKAMTQTAGPVKLTFYCPLVGQLDDGECDEYIDVGSGFLTAYQDQIEQGIADEQAPEMGDDGQDTTPTVVVNIGFPVVSRSLPKGKLSKVSEPWRSSQAHVGCVDGGGNGRQALGPDRLPPQGTAYDGRDGRFAGGNPRTMLRRAWRRFRAAAH